jgi:hypothetical protein
VQIGAARQLDRPVVAARIAVQLRVHGPDDRQREEPPPARDRVPAPLRGRDRPGRDVPGADFQIPLGGQHRVVRPDLIQRHVHPVGHKGDRLAVELAVQHGQRPGLKIQPGRVGPHAHHGEHEVRVGHGGRVEQFGHLDAPHVGTHAGQPEHQALQNIAGVHPGAVQGRAAGSPGLVEHGQPGRAVRGRVVVARGGDHVLARAQQRAQVFIVPLVGQLQPRGVDHHVRVQGQDLGSVPGRDDAGGRVPGDRARVLPGLALGVHVQPGQVQVRVVQHRAQAGLAHRSGSPLHDSISHFSACLPFILPAAPARHPQGRGRP